MMIIVFLIRMLCYTSMGVTLSNVWSRNQINLICIKYYNPKLVADVAPWASLYFSWLGMSAFIHDSFRRDSTSAMTRQHSIGIQLRINMLLITFNFERKKILLHVLIFSCYKSIWMFSSQKWFIETFLTTLKYKKYAIINNINANTI